MDNKTALIIDDSATARSVLKHQLTKLGLEVQSAESGESALQLLKTDQPDVIFLDHVMPGMDGFEVLESLKNQDSTESIPVIMYTSQAATSYAQKAKSLGALGVLPKQVNAERVRLILDRTNLFKSNEQEALPGTPDQLIHARDTTESNTHYNQPASTSSTPSAFRPNDRGLGVSSPVTDTYSEQRKQHVTEQEREASETDKNLGSSKNVPLTPYLGTAEPPFPIQSTNHTPPLFSAHNLLVFVLVIGQVYWIFQVLEQQQQNNRLEAKLEHYQQQNTESLESIRQLQQSNQNTNDEIYFVLETLISKVLEPPTIASSASSADSPGDINSEALQNNIEELQNDTEERQNNTESSPADLMPVESDQSEKQQGGNETSTGNQTEQMDLESEDDNNTIE